MFNVEKTALEAFTRAKISLMPLEKRSAWAQQQIARIESAKVWANDRETGIHKLEDGRKIFPDEGLAIAMQKSYGWTFEAQFSRFSPTGHVKIINPHGETTHYQDPSYHEAIRSAVGIAEPLLNKLA